MKEKIVIFNGKKYYLNKRGYYRRYDEHRKMFLLHRDIWDFYNGPIPLKHDIHHVDFNKFNNDISNLICLSKHDHQKLHGQTEKRKLLGKMVGEWGRGKPEPRSLKVCHWCGKEFSGVPCQIYGSHRCAWEWHNHNKPFKYKKICCICGREFMTQHKVVTTCCNECTQKKKSILAKEYARKKGYKVKEP